MQRSYPWETWELVFQKTPNLLGDFPKIIDTVKQRQEIWHIAWYNEERANQRRQPYLFPFHPPGIPEQTVMSATEWAVVALNQRSKLPRGYTYRNTVSDEEDIWVAVLTVSHPLIDLEHREMWGNLYQGTLDMRTDDFGKLITPEPFERPLQIASTRGAHCEIWG